MEPDGATQAGVGRIEVFGVGGLPEITEGMDLARMIADAARAQGDELRDGDVVLVTSKIVSKVEGRTVELDDVEPSEFALRWSAAWDKDPRVTEIVLRESRRIVRQLGPVLITETHHGFCCANSGVDQSSSGAAGRVLTLPLDPDSSCRAQRARFAQLGADVAVIMTDTFGRPWREGQTDVAIGIAGMHPLRSYIGQHDPHGHEFRVQEICLADELAAAAELVKGNTSRVPVAVVRGFDFEPDEGASMAPVLRDTERDLFR